MIKDVIIHYKGTRQIRVILYAKGTLHGAPTPAGELSIEDVLTRRARRYPTR
jgi:hypothetical protein